MSLSDSCSDVLNELATEIVHYADWDYAPKQLIPIFDALYSLATFTGGQAVPPSISNINLNIGIHRVVIGSSLNAKTDDDEFGKASAVAILKLLADVSKIHSHLESGLVAIQHEITTNANSIMFIHNPKILSQLEAIRAHQA